MYGDGFPKGSRTRGMLFGAIGVEVSTLDWSTSERSTFESTFDLVGSIVESPFVAMFSRTMNSFSIVQIVLTTYVRYSQRFWEIEVQIAGINRICEGILRRIEIYGKWEMR